MDDNERSFLLAVAGAAAWSPRALASWMRALGSAREIVAYARHAASYALQQPPPGAERLPAPALARVARIDAATACAALQTARSCGASIVTQQDADYPPALRDLTDAPLVLYVRGSLRGLNERTAAIVGSRAASAYGRSIAGAFAAGFAAYGVTIISGLARGIDAAAHRNALDAGTPTVAILGSGLRTLYPPYHALLADEIVERGGALVSEFAPDEPARTFQFPMRNRIVAALARATVVVEASERSGALITARLADELGRPVFAVPGDIDRPTSRGTNALIADGIAMATSAADVAAMMRWDVVITATPSQPSATDDAAASLDDALLALLTAGGAAPDELAAASGASAAEVAARLTLLELAGAIERRSGGLYAPVRRGDASKSGA